MKNPCSKCPFGKKIGREYYCSILSNETEQKFGNITIRGNMDGERPARYVKDTYYCIKETL